VEEEKVGGTEPFKKLSGLPKVSFGPCRGTHLGLPLSEKFHYGAGVDAARGPALALFRRGWRQSRVSTGPFTQCRLAVNAASNATTI
jgi:hypothetical protein